MLKCRYLIALPVLLLAFSLSFWLTLKPYSSRGSKEQQEYSAQAQAPASSPAASPVSTGLPAGEASSLLSICPDGISFCDRGQPAVLHGADAPHLLWGESQGSWQWAGLDRLEQDVGELHGWGGNFVVINFDPGRVEDAQYAAQIVEAAQYAHDLGLHVELMQHHSKWSLQDGKPVFTPLPITDLDPATLTTDVDQRWMELLSHPGVAESLSQSVDIFGIFSEPDQQVSLQFPIQATTAISWQRWRPRAEKACLDIRARIKRQAICSISGVEWAWNVSGYLSDPFHIPSAALEVHQYQHLEASSQDPLLDILGVQVAGFASHLDRGSNWERAAGKVPLIMGEFGNDDPPDYVRGLVSDLDAHQVSWAAWSLIGWGPQEGMIDCTNRRVLPLGQIVKSALSGDSALRPTLDP